jgi:hypothetical protein
MLANANSYLKNSVAFLGLVNQKEIIPLKRTVISLFDLIVPEQPVIKNKTLTFDQISTVAMTFALQIVSQHKTIESNHKTKVNNQFGFVGLLRQLT